MSDVPCLSIVSVVRNDVAGLRVTYSSISRQRNAPHIDLVVIDGASSDGTQSWEPEAPPAWLEVQFCSAPDNGIYDAMNKGARRARGELMLFLNAGDEFADPETAAYIADDWAARRWSWAYGDTARWTDGQFDSIASNHPFNSERMARGRFWVPHQAAVFTRDLINQVGGYDTTLGLAADQDLIFRCAQVSPPHEWRRTIANFQNGGAHSQIGVRQRELEWYRLRRKNVDQRPISRVLDRCLTEVGADYRATRGAVRRVIEPTAPKLVAKYRAWRGSDRF